MCNFFFYSYHFMVLTRGRILKESMDTEKLSFRLKSRLFVPKKRLLRPKSRPFSWKNTFPGPTSSFFPLRMSSCFHQRWRGSFSAIVQEQEQESIFLKSRLFWHIFAKVQVFHLRSPRVVFYTRSKKPVTLHLICHWHGGGKILSCFFVWFSSILISAI